MLGAAGVIVVLVTVAPVWAQDGGNDPYYCEASCEPALEIAEDPNLIGEDEEFFVPPTYRGAAVVPEEPAVSEERLAANEESLVA